MRDQQRQLFLNLAPALAPNTGIWLTASTTAKVAGRQIPTPKALSSNTGLLVKASSHL
jgi:hypothetical protein